MFVPIHDVNNKVKHIPWPYVTHLFIAINVVIYLIINAMPVDEGAATTVLLSYKPDGVPAAAVQNLPMPSWDVPVPLGILTSMFLHADFMHLLGNMLFLWVFGDNVEDAMGHGRFAVFYIVCGVVAAVVQDLMTEPGWIFYGASGATSGVVAAFVMLHPRVRVWVLVFMRFPLPVPALWMIVVWLVFQVVNALNAQQDASVAWYAHIAGAAAGAALIPFLKKPNVPLFDQGLPKTVPKAGGG